MNSTKIPAGRSLTDETCDLYAGELIEVLKVWGMTAADAWRVNGYMRDRLKNTVKGEWKSPLDGTGLVADRAAEGGIIRKDDNGVEHFGVLGSGPSPKKQN